MDLDAVAVFVEAVRVGSLAGAARRLEISAMAASRALTALERELGVRLIHRNTRSLSPTTDGETFLPHAQTLLDGQSQALEELRPAGPGISGHLRITASAAFGRKVITKVLSPFMIENPRLHVDLRMTDDQIDIVGQGVDVAIRIAKLRDNHLVAKRLAPNPRRLCAAPGYLKAHGRPATLAELAGHECLVGAGLTHWSFVPSEGTGPIRQKVSGRFCTTSVEGLYEACLGELGIANLSGWLTESALRSGALEEIILEDAQVEPLAIWAVFPSARLVPAKVRLFLEALQAELASPQYPRA